MAISIPKDGVIVRDTKRTDVDARYVMYTVNGMSVFFSLFGDEYDTTGMEEWDRYYLGSYDIFSDPKVIHTTRTAKELQGIVASWGSFANWYNHLMTTFIRSPEARADQGVQRLIMEMSFRPDMSETEFQARMQETDYWKSRNDRQREWNDLSPAEQNSQVEETRARLADEYWQAVGVVVDANDPQIMNWAREVAAGNMGFGAAVDAIRSIARRNPESPWSRTVRNEEENQRQRGQDLSDMAGRVRSQAELWGVRLAGDAVSRWANDIVGNFKSEADLQEYLKDQAVILYPSKDREVTAQDYGQAYRSVYEQILERPEVSIFNPDIQKAMQGNVAIADFERELKKRPEWLETSNAFDTLNRNVGGIGQKMGFV